MCGIVGYTGTTGNRTAMGVLLSGLRRLEYRGYDSSGVAWMVPAENKIEIRKSEGKLENVEKLLAQENGKRGATQSLCGIGHTRWATHGKPTTQNAHPHQTGHVALVHNGIIENFQELRRDLMARGHQPQSETDSELYGFLVLEEMNRGSSLKDAVLKTFPKLEGACSIVIMSEREPGVIVGVRNGSPLVAATVPSGGGVIASDAQAIIEINRDVVFLENGDLAYLSAQGIEYYDVESGKKVQRKPHHIDWSVDRMDKQGFAHFMQKEIFEQPTALIDTLNGLMDRVGDKAFDLAKQPGAEILSNAQELHLVACGTSSYAALLGEYWFERWARVPVKVQLASEMRYRPMVLGQSSAIIAISQSGETADTLAVVREAKKNGARTVAITNVRGSTLARECDAVIYTFAGPEIGVAATKSFLTQLATLFTLAGAMGVQRRGQKAEFQTLYSELLRVPHVLSALLVPNGPWVTAIQMAAKDFVSSRGFFFMGRGYSYPVALEGALKLKEIAYVHAEGYAAGELKHGPIAMIDSTFAVVALAPRDHWREKTISNIQEVRARGARILGVGHEDDHELRSLCSGYVGIPTQPQIDESLLPFLLTPVMQLFSYELACLKGTDVDKPRNLAKSVTVE